MKQEESLNTKVSSNTHSIGRQKPAKNHWEVVYRNFMIFLGNRNEAGGDFNMEHINREAGMCSGDKDPKTGQKSNYGMEKHGLEQIHHAKLSESMFSRTYWKVTIYFIPYSTSYITETIVEIVFDSCYISRYKDKMSINYYLGVFKG